MIMRNLVTIFLTALSAAFAVASRSIVELIKELLKDMEVPAAHV